MPSFVHPGLLGPMFATLLVAASIPVAIHLINMLRHRRVHWAAMEFLLASHKRNRTWVRMKELLLLLLRMAAMAIIVLMVAQPLLGSRLGRLFGALHTHHVILLDDSFSMSDHWADTAAFAEAKQMIHRLAAQAAERADSQSFTLLRFSRAGRLGRDTQPDLLQEQVNRQQFVQTVDDALGKIQVTQLSVGPLESLKAIGQLLGDARGERRVVYLVSDFRRRDWNDPTAARELLEALARQDVEIHFVDCVDRARPNLAIADLRPEVGVQAAAVQFFMELTVQNFGDAEVRDAAVMLEEDGSARPAVTVARIPAGRSVTERFRAGFATAGEHVLRAALEGDAVAADNVRYSALDLPADVPVLLVDGDPAAAAAHFIDVACAPGGPARTGLRPQIEMPRYLTFKSPAAFAAIDLMNIDSLDRSAITAIEQFVAAGGGVAVFLDARTSAAFVNDALYRNGEGFFPAPLGAPVDLPVDRLEHVADIDVEDHPIFRVFADPRNRFLDTVTVSRYYETAAGWSPAPAGDVRVLARLRNGAPLVIERRFGQGRVVAFLTSAAPTWNNWARNLSYAAMMLDLHAYLAERTAGERSRPVGTPLEVTLAGGHYQPDVRFRGPGETTDALVTATPTADGALQAQFTETDRAGVYAAQLTKTDGTIETRSFAYNVDTGEGDLSRLPRAELADRLQGVPLIFDEASSARYATREAAGVNLGVVLLYVLAGLLLLEQATAFWASYHPPLAAVAAAKGGGR